MSKPKPASPLASWQRLAATIAATGAAIAVLYAGWMFFDSRWVLSATYAADYRQLTGDLAATNRVILEGQLREITGRILILEGKGTRLTPEERAYLITLRQDAERIRQQLAGRPSGWR